MIDSLSHQKLVMLEDVMSRGATRNASALAPFTRGNLAGLVKTLLDTPTPCVALLSGYWILHSKPPSAETDGPVGVALLGRFFKRIGWRAVGITDLPCEVPLRGAFTFAEMDRDDVFVASKGEGAAEATPIASLRSWLAQRKVTHLLSIERPGVSADGKYYNMRASDLTENVYPFDELFRRPDYVTAAIGDGGNEIGMGSIPREVIGREIAHGETIACVTPSEFTLVCGVSNWGAHMIAAALSVLSPAFREVFDEVFSESNETEALRRVSEAGAVDGVSGLRALSVDGISMEEHFEKYNEMRFKLSTFQERK